MDFIKKKYRYYFFATIFLFDYSGIAFARQNDNPSFQAPTNYSASANPGAINIVTGTGALGRLFGVKKSSGFRLSGSWIANGNTIFSGGSGVDKNTANNLAIIDAYLNAATAFGWSGASFGAEFLQFNGQDTNAATGAVQSFNSLSACAPFNRSELYQAWYRQILFNDKLIVRIGKTVPTYDFTNVLRTVPFGVVALNIPSISGLLYTPIFVNSSMLGVMPGYYNSAYGITANFTPSKYLYASGGAYDGNLARGVQTGLTGPSFNGYYLYIGETGADWTLGPEHKPGKFAVGAWHQTGRLSENGITQKDTSGFYSFGSQRLWYRSPGINNSGISGFFQYGINDSKTLPMKEYLGLGLTAFGLTRHKDSFGVGAAIAWLNHNEFVRKHEVIYQLYYQYNLMSGVYLTGALTYIPKPGATTTVSHALAGTLQLMTLF